MADKSKQPVSRFVAYAEDGIFYNSDRPITEDDKKYANDVWATMTDQKTDNVPEDYIEVIE